MDVLKRFLDYVSYETNSDENSQTHPSSAKQLILGKRLAQDLAEIGLEDAHLDEYGYVYGWLPATPGMEHVPTLGLIGHMDTAPSVSDQGIKPRVVEFTGEPIALNDSVTLVPEACYAGQPLVVTDGTTLLGGDDKAGVAEIFSAMAWLKAHPEVPHGRVAVGITPDEEIGKGADLFNVEKFGAATAYTVDGGALGEIEYENFNGAAAEIVFNGVNMHPGSSKGKMRNSLLLANELLNLLPPAETPAHTEGYEGFYHVCDIAGDETRTVLHLIIRDHCLEKFNARKETLTRICDYLNAKYGAGVIELKLKDSYYNMRSMIEPHMYLIENLKEAMVQCGVEPLVMPIRGGTDGARLSYMGLPCPNMCTGGHNFHSVTEYAPVKSMEKMVEVLVKLITLQK